MSNYTNVSFYGTDKEKDDLTVLSKFLKIPVGMMVRNAIHQVYGDYLNRIDEIRTSFYVDASASMHSDDTGSTEGDE